MEVTEDELRAALGDVRLVVMDVDGVLTDGRLFYTADGDGVAFDVRDGQALRWLQRSEIGLAWITGRGGPAVARRARELDVLEFHARASDKAATLREIQSRLGVSASATLAIGDDLPDLALAAHARLFAAPRDACAEVRDRAQLVTDARGGRGAVREVIERILQAQGRWDALVAGYAG